MRIRVFVLALAFGCSGAKAHDVWNNGLPVPGWVKAACCGPEDVHHLRPDQVHRISESYYEVDGYQYPIPVQKALPSQDGDYWIFYRDNVGGSQSGVFCFFVPVGF